MVETDLKNICKLCNSPETPNLQLASCDSCNVKLCQECSELTSTEFRAVVLKKRVIKHYCKQCRLESKRAENEVKFMKNAIENLLAQLPIIVSEQCNKYFTELRAELADLRSKVVLNQELPKASISTNKKYSAAVINKNETKTPNEHETKRNEENTKPKPNTHKNISRKETTPQLPNGDDSKEDNKELEDDESENNFQLVRNGRQRRNPKNKQTIGDGPTTDEDFSGAEKRVWLLLTRVKRDANDEKIKLYLNKKPGCKDIEFVLKELPSEETQNRCFMFGAPFRMKDEVYQKSFWPCGVGFQRFDFRKYNSIRSKLENNNANRPTDFL